MKNIVKNQRGAIDIILILVVFVFAAALGGYVYYNQQQANKVYDAAGNGAMVTKHLAKKKATPAVDPTAKWVAYSSAVGDFSLKYPSTWVTPSQKELCNPGLFDRAIYLGPTVATVLKCATEYFGMVAVLSVDGDKRADYAFDATTYGSITKTAVTVDGSVGERSSATVIKVDDGPTTMKVGDKAIHYTFYANGITYVATYNQQAGNPDVSSDFDTLVKSTLRFD